jgi:protocatechuate 3,4-dioxygenase beta subunit
MPDDFTEGGHPMSRIILSRRQMAASIVGAGALLAAPRALALQARQPTPESDMGPFYPAGQRADEDADLTRIGRNSPRAQGNVIELRGRVLDLRGNPVRGATLEMWQCNAAGRYLHANDVSTAPLDPNFRGFARLRSGRDGSFRLITIKPGGYDSPIGHRPPHLHWDLIGRTDRRITQMYFPEDADANAADRLYRNLGTAGPNAVARRERDGLYHWDIVLADA